MNNYRIMLLNPRNPRAYTYAGSAPFNEHLGLGYVAASLRKAGFQVKLVNLEEAEGEKPVLEEIIHYHPDFVGCTASFETIDQVLLLAEELKKADSSLHICLGGHHATFCADVILEKHPCVDSIVRGEGEVTAVDLASALAEKRTLEGVEGIYYRERNGIFRNRPRKNIEDLDRLTFPLRGSLITSSRGQDSRLPGLLILSSRGCSGSCTFCSASSFYRLHGPSGWRPRSPRNFVDEIEYLNSKFGAVSFVISDDNFVCPGRESRERAAHIAREITGRGLRILFGCAFRPDSLNPEDPEDVRLLMMLKKAGLFNVYLGVESACESELRLYHKGTTLRRIIHMLALFESLGIPTEIGFIMFNPFSTAETLTRNAEFLHRIRKGILFQNFWSRIQLHPGARLVEMLDRRGMLEEPGGLSDVYYYRFTDPVARKVAEAVHAIYPDMALIDGIVSSSYLNLFYILKKMEILQKVSPDSFMRGKFAATLTQYHQAVEDLNNANFRFFIQTIRIAKERWSEEEFEESAHSHIMRMKGLSARLEGIYLDQCECIQEYMMNIELRHS